MGDVHIRDSTAAQGMDTNMFQGNHFINADGVRLREDEILTRETRNGQQVVSVTTPRVQAVVREHFQCSSMVGAELEDDGGEGTAGSHWEQRLFEGKLSHGRGVAPLPALPG
jgi:hypothetical protein